MSPTENTHIVAFTTIVLAAGKGTRMKSPVPKVLHRICGWPMLRHVCEEVEQAGSLNTIIVTSNALYPILESEAWLKKSGLRFVIQNKQLGTGDAVAACAGILAQEIPHYTSYTLPEKELISQGGDYILICAGDCPAIQAHSIRSFVESCRQQDADIGLLGIRLHDPRGYGRIVMDNNRVEKIVEEKDADNKEKLITLCNSGVICGKTQVIFKLLANLTPKNAQGEYYLTDVFAAAREQGLSCHLYEHAKAGEWQGVNDPWQLANLEVMMIAAMAEAQAKAGIRFYLPHTVYLEKEVQMQSGVQIFPQVILRGATNLEEGVQVGQGTQLVNVHVKKGLRIGPYKYFENCVIEEHVP